MDNNGEILYSSLERFEIINISDGEKYNLLKDNDIIVDEEGKFKFLILPANISSGSFFSSNREEYLEIPWECVKKIGTKAIIIDSDQLSN
ncbi:MAG: YlmC/YmxH family sporulation protein [Oscillospiraceae bacterium]|nr:YlmC/YmxH family sporulation protein [Oscillospiraceae bacterium]